MTITSLVTTNTDDGQVLSRGPLDDPDKDLSKPLYRIRYLPSGARRSSNESKGKQWSYEGKQWSLSSAKTGVDLGDFRSLEGAQYCALSHAIEHEAEVAWEEAQSATIKAARLEAEQALADNSTFPRATS